MSTEPTNEQSEIRFADFPTNPNNPPWNGWIALLVWLASVFLILLVPSIFLLPYLAANRGQFSSPDQIAQFAVTDNTAILLQIIAIIPAHILTLLLAWFVVTNFRKFSFRQTLGWKSGGMKWWHYILVLGSFLGFAAIVGYFLPEQENDMLRILRSSRTAVFIVAFLATFTAPLVEEVIYRGILYSAFQRAFGMTLAVVIVTILFSAVHVPQYYPSTSTIILLTLLSLILTLVRVTTGNLLPCIILHTIFNGVQSIVLILEPYSPPISPAIPEPALILHFLK